MPETVVLPSRYAFAESVSRLKGAIAESGATLFAEIDQSAAASSVGLALRPTTLLLFGRPEAGTVLMDEFPTVALDLPLKLLVWESGGSVSVAYTPARSVALSHGVTGKDSVIHAMDAALAAISASVS